VVNRLANATRLRSRIYFGYAAVGGLALIVLALAFVSMQRIGGQFALFSDSSNRYRLGLQVSSAMVSMQRAVQAYIYQGHSSAADQVDTLYNQLNALVNSDGFVETIDVTRFAEIRRLLSNYYATFLEAKELRSQQIMLLEDSIPGLKAELLRLISVLEPDGDDSTLLTRNLLLTADADIYRYFDSLASARVDKALEALSRAREMLGVRENAGRAIDALDVYEEQVLRAVQGIRGYTYLLNVVIAAEAYEILYQADTLATLANSTMETNEAAIVAAVPRALTIMGVSFVTLILLMLLVATVIGRSISRPIERITAVFRQLAVGNSEGSIPVFDSKDELSELSRAATVFRDNNEETKSLLERYQTLSESLERQVASRTGQLSTALAAAESAAKAKSAFLANMSHEIRTPVHALQGQLQLLETTRMTAEQRDYIRQAWMVNKVLARLLDDILDFSKIEAGRMELEDEPFNLFGVLEEMETLFEGQAQDKGLAFSVVPDPNFPEWVRGDVTRLTQVLMNLLSNAVKFTDQGTVQLRARLDGQRDDGSCAIRFEIQDTGVGIAQDKLDMVYEEFSQAESSTTRSFGGTGLGLAIARHIVTLMGGELTLSSVLGEGTLFTVCVTLTALTRGEELALLGEPEDAMIDLSKNCALADLRILLVEDNPSLQTMTRLILEQQGARVKMAGDGREALEIFATDEAFDVVLMDVQMPELSGLDVTRIIRKRYSPERLPIIAMTANATRSDRDAAAAAQMNDFLAKPVDFRRLCTTIRRVVENTAGFPPEVREEIAESEESATYPGFELGDAVARMSGNLEVYALSAQPFVDGYLAILAALQQAVADADDERASALSHELKGSASLLGAQALYAAAAQAERAFLDGPSREAAAALISGVSQHCRDAASTLQLILSDIQKRGSTSDCQLTEGGFEK